MIIASIFLPLLFLAYMCLCFILGVVMPALFLICAVVNFILFAVLLVLYFRLRRKGWFVLSPEQDQYWKNIGKKAGKVSVLILLSLSGIGFLIFAALAAILLL